MKLLSFYFLLIFSALLESCDRGNAESISQKPDPVTVTVVLCDLTKSIDTSAIYHISEHAVQINSLSKKGSQVFYYGIGPNDYNVPISESFYQKPPRRETDEERATRIYMKHCNDSLLGVKIKLNYDSKKYQNTCITYALSTAFQLLKEKKETSNNATLNIVVLSDMIEDCDHNSLGKLHMDTKEKMALTKRVIAKDAPTNLNLKSLGVHIYMVSESEIALTKLSRGELEDTWRALLTKYGYDENDDLVNFEWQRLPDQLWN